MRVRPSLLIGTIALSCSAAGAATAQERHAYIVVDPQTQQVLYESNAQARRFPASITKVMTVYLIFEAIEQGRLSWDSRITFSRNASRQPPTKLGVAPGGSISVEDAVNALIIRSANDVATAVAENLAGSEAAFARQMTERARSLGMARTQFRNASGLPDSNQFSTAEDLARLSIAIRRDFPQHFHMFSRTQFTYGGTVIYGHNRVMTSVDGVDGLKTGYTRSSGFNLATTAGRDNQRLVTVVLGGATSAARNAEVTNLVETGFNALGVRRYVLDVAAPAAVGLYDRRDAGDLLALASEVPVAIQPSTPVVLAGLGRADRPMSMPAGPGGWQPPSTFAAVQPPPRTFAANLPVARPTATQPALVMSAAEMAGINPAGGEEDGDEPAVASVMLAAIPAVAPVEVPVMLAATETVATPAPVEIAAINTAPPPNRASDLQLAASFPPVQQAALPTEPASPVALRGSDPAQSMADAPAVTEPMVQMAEAAAVSPFPSEIGASATGASATGAPATGAAEIVAPEEPPAETSPGAPVQFAMAVAAPETIRSTPVVTFTVPEMMTPSAPVSGVTGTGQPGMADGADSTATGTPADAPTRLADTSLEPWLQPADAMPGEAAPSEPPEGNVAPVQMAAVVFNGDTSILPVAEAVPDEEPGATHSAAPALGADGAVQDQPRDAEPIQLAALEAPASQPQSGADAVMPEPVMTATVSLPADALALTEQMRREAAAREAARIAAIDAAEARQAAAARAAREAQARERQLAEQRARETRQREMAEQQARALRERQLAERREREEAAAAEAENQRRMAALRGNSGVQIGAYRSERDARDALREGSRFAPSFARGEVSRVETSDGVFFRARFTGLAASAARALCGQITSGGGTKQCLILGN